MCGCWVTWPVNLSMNFLSSNPPFPFHKTEEGRGDLFNGMVDLQRTVNLTLAAAACCRVHSCVALRASFCLVFKEFSDDAVEINSSLQPT